MAPPYVAPLVLFLQGVERVGRSMLATARKLIDVYLRLTAFSKRPDTVVTVSLTRSALHTAMVLVTHTESWETRDAGGAPMGDILWMHLR